MGSFILFLFCSTRLFAAEVVVDRILSVVNEDVITQLDLKKYKETFHIRKGSMSSGDFDATMNSDEKMLNKIIDEKIITQYAAEKEMKTTEEDINEAINRILRQYNMTLAQLKQQLEREGITYELFKREKEKEITLSKVLESEIKRTANITEDDLKKFFKEKTKEDVNVTEYRIQAVLAPKEETIKEALAASKSGTSFEDLVRTYSDDESSKDNDGDLGFFSPSALVQELRTPVLSMSIGDVKGPIEVKSKKSKDYYLIKLAEVKNSENPHYTASKDDLRREVLGNEINRQLNLWLERRRSESYVKINKIGV